MAGRASVVLREQFEAAKRDAESHGTITPIIEVRMSVDVAISTTREKVRLMKDAASPSGNSAPTPESFAFLSEERLLRDELLELERLRDHIMYLMGAVAR